jgi:hypothetical protein
MFSYWMLRIKASKQTVCGVIRKNGGLIVSTTLGTILIVIIQLIIDTPALLFIWNTFGRNFEMKISYMPLVIGSLVFASINFFTFWIKICFVTCFALGALSMHLSGIYISGQYIAVEKNAKALNTENYLIMLLLPIIIAEYSVSIICSNSIGSALTRRIVSLIFSCRNGYCLGQTLYLSAFYFLSKLKKLL